MARGNPAALSAWRRHVEPYTRGLKPFSAEFKAAQKRASATWHSGSGGSEHHETNPELIPEFHGGHKVLLGIAAAAGGFWLFKRWQASNAVRQANDAAARRRALDQLGDNTQESRAIESKAIAGVQSHSPDANVWAQTVGKPGF